MQHFLVELLRLGLQIYYRRLTLCCISHFFSEYGCDGLIVGLSQYQAEGDSPSPKVMRGRSGRFVRAFPDLSETVINCTRLFCA